MQHVSCPMCGASANVIVTLGVTITACSTCAQATIAESDVVLRLDRERWSQGSAVTKELIVIAHTAEAIYKNWHIIGPHVPIAK